MLRAPHNPALFGLWLVMLWSGAALGQGVPVIDNAAIIAAQQNLAALQQQVQQLQALSQTTQSLARSIGSLGTLTLPSLPSVTSAGLAQFSGQFTTNLSRGSADLSNFTNAQQWVSQNLTSTATDSATARATVRQARVKISGEIAADGYALAVTARAQATDTMARAQDLASQVGSATNLREDVAANSAIMLAIHDEMAEIQALLAANLAMQSSDQLSLGDALPASSAAASHP